MDAYVGIQCINPAPNPPAAGTEASGVVVANIASASGLLVGLSPHGTRVPVDLSVIAIHDHPLAGAFDPPLPTVSLPLFEMGRRTVALLLDTGLLRG